MVRNQRFPYVRPTLVELSFHTFGGGNFHTFGGGTEVGQLNIVKAVGKRRKFNGEDRGSGR